MVKWLRQPQKPIKRDLIIAALLLLVIITIFVFFSTPIWAMVKKQVETAQQWLFALTQDITITGTPDVGVPQATGIWVNRELKLTKISESEVKLDWEPITPTVMIRAKYGGYPANTADGYLVYTGTATTTNDTAVSLDETTTNIYYTAWFQDGGGDWLNDTLQNNIGGIGMTLVAEVLVIGFLLILTFWRRDVFLYIITGLAMIAFGLGWYDDYNSSTGFVVSICLMGIGVYSLILGGYNLIKSRRG